MSAPMDKDPSATQPLSLIEAAQLVFLDAKKLRFSRHGATLRLTVADDRSCLNVRVLRAFPLSDPKQYLSVREAGGREIGVLSDPGQLDTENRKMVDEELERRYLTLRILRVLGVTERFGTSDWEVETDRGKKTFTTRNLRENVQRPTPGRIILIDTDNNRYAVDSLDDLDLSSRELILEQL